MRKVKINIRLVFGFLALASLVKCTPKELTPEELITWVHNPDNNFSKEKELDDIGFRIKYKPLDYLVAFENRDKVITDSIYQSSKEKYTDIHSVNLTIYPVNGSQQDLLNYNTSSIQEHQEKIYYYSFPFQNDIYLIQGADTLPCVLYNFARDHGLSPELNFALGFENRQSEGDLQIVINDVVFGNGTLNFVIKEKDIEGLPSLKI